MPQFRYRADVVKVKTGEYLTFVLMYSRRTEAPSLEHVKIDADRYSRLPSMEWRKSNGEAGYLIQKYDTDPGYFHNVDVSDLPPVIPKPVAMLSAREDAPAKRPYSLPPEIFKQLEEKGGRWATYENHDLSDSSPNGLGHRQYLKFGPDCTFFDAPRMIGKNGSYATSSRSVFIGEVNMSYGDIMGYRSISSLPPQTIRAVEALALRDHPDKVPVVVYDRDGDSPNHYSVELRLTSGVTVKVPYSNVEVHERMLPEEAWWAERVVVDGGTFGIPPEWQVVGV
jgi:hypothetical protein